MFRYLLFSVFLFFCTFADPLFAAVRVSEEHAMEDRHFDQKKIEQFKKDKDFFYAISTPPDSLWRSFLNWLVQKLKSIFKNVPDDKLFSAISLSFRILLWVIGIFAVVMIFVSLFKFGVFNFIGKNVKPIKPEYEDLEANVVETDWTGMFEKEIREGRYKTAVRLLFLYTLQQLDRKGLIAWKKDKTNREYMAELKNTNIYPDFQQLTVYYDHVWFGDFDINELKFNRIYKHFQQFNEIGK